MNRHQQRHANALRFPRLPENIRLTTHFSSHQARTLAVSLAIPPLFRHTEAVSATFLASQRVSAAEIHRDMPQIETKKSACAAEMPPFAYERKKFALLLG